MRRIKKFLALGLAGALTVSALAGCGGKETGADAGSSAESGENTGGVNPQAPLRAPATGC